MTTNFDDVGDFHQKFNLPLVHQAPYHPCLREKSPTMCPGPREVTTDLLAFRTKFMLEELREFITAAGLDVELNVMTGDMVVHVPERPLVYHPDMFDALLDLVYVAMGTAHLLGYPWQEGWDAVQKANMEKVRAAKDGSDSKRASAWDVVKPKGWRAPDIRGILRKYGFTL